MTETCGICDQSVPFSATVHVLVHTHGETGVVDQYVCRACYEDRVAPLLE